MVCISIWINLKPFRLLSWIMCWPYHGYTHGILSIYRWAAGNLFTLKISHKISICLWDILNVNQFPAAQSNKLINRVHTYIYDILQVIPEMLEYLAGPPQHHKFSMSLLATGTSPILPMVRKKRLSSISKRDKKDFCVRRRPAQYLIKSGGTAKTPCRNISY